MTPFQNAKEISSEILSIVANGEFDHYGIRALTICDEADAALPAPTIGTTLNNSRVWSDGEITDEELNGTCALGLSIYDAEDADYELPRIECDLRHLDNQYAGRYIVLLGSNRVKGGEDMGEYIMAQAQVLAVWDRGEDTFTELQ